jgi:hypothetical protein
MRDRSEATESFGEQAAKFSLYVPLAVLLIGCFSRSAANSGKDAAGAPIALFWLQIVLIVAGFVLGIVALVSMKKYGTERILGRAIAGILFNGLVLGLVAVLLLPLVGLGQSKTKVVGTWRAAGGNPEIKQMDMTFNKDGSFHFVTIARDLRTVTMDGKWGLTESKFIGLEFTNAPAESQLAGKKIGLGRIKTIDAQRMTVITDKGEETYQRTQ